MKLCYDRAAGFVFLSSLFNGEGEGTVEVRAIDAQKNKPTERRWIAAPGEEVEFVEWAIRNRMDVYCGVALRTKDSSTQKNGSAEFLLSSHWLYVEMDGRDYGGELGGVRERIAAFPSAPYMVICSGGGYHCYWKIERLDLTSPAQRAGLKETLTELIARTGAGQESKDPTRILRLPGTFNFKPQYGDPRPVTFASDIATDQHVYHIDDFPKPPKKDTAKEKPNTATHSTPHGNTATADELLRRAHRQGGRHKGGVWLAAQLRDNLYSEAEGERVMEDYQRQTTPGDHPYTLAEALTTLHSIYATPARKAWAEPAVDLQAVKKARRAAKEQETDTPREKTRAIEAPQEDADTPAEETAEAKQADPQEEEEHSEGFPCSLFDAIGRMEGDLKRLSVRVDGCMLTFQKRPDPGDMREIGKILKTGTDRVTTVMNFLWACWYMALPKKPHGVKRRIINELFGGEGSLMAMNQQNRLSDLARVAGRIPFQHWTMNRSWAFYERVARLATQERREYWLQQPLHKGMFAAMDAELLAEHEAQQAHEQPGATEHCEPRPDPPRNTPTGTTSAPSPPPFPSPILRNTVEGVSLPVLEEQVDTATVTVSAEMARLLETLAAQAIHAGSTPEAFLRSLLNTSPTPCPQPENESKPVENDEKEPKIVDELVETSTGASVEVSTCSTCFEDGDFENGDPFDDEYEDEFEDLTDDPPADVSPPPPAQVPPDPDYARLFLLLDRGELRGKTVCLDGQVYDLG